MRGIKEKKDATSLKLRQLYNILPLVFYFENQSYALFRIDVLKSEQIFVKSRQVS